MNKPATLNLVNVRSQGDVKLAYSPVKRSYFSSWVGSRGTINSRPSQLDPDMRVSVHPAPDILGFCLAPVLVIVAALVQCFQILLAPV